jgi:hypothetical protein
VPVSFVAVLMGLEFLGGLFMRLFPISVMGFVAWLFWIRYRLGSLGGYYSRRDIIREELKRRKGEVNDMSY